MNTHAASSKAQSTQPNGDALDIERLGRLMEQVIGNLTTQAQVNDAITRRLLALENSIQKVEASVAAVNAAPAPARPVYLGHHTAMTRVRNRYKMYVDTRDLSLSPSLLLDGDWEPSMAALFLTLVRP